MTFKYELLLFPECVDENKYCRNRAENRECETNPRYMLNYCKRSCNVCRGKAFLTFQNYIQIIQIVVCIQNVFAMFKEH